LLIENNSCYFKALEELKLQVNFFTIHKIGKQWLKILEIMNRPLAKPFLQEVKRKQEAKSRGCSSL
jgi:hypothetical protein